MNVLMPQMKTLVDPVHVKINTIYENIIMTCRVAMINQYIYTYMIALFVTSSVCCCCFQSSQNAHKCRPMYSCESISTRAIDFSKLKFNLFWQLSVSICIYLFSRWRRRNVHIVLFKLAHQQRTSCCSFRISSHFIDDIVKSVADSIQTTSSGGRRSKSINVRTGKSHRMRRKYEL